MQYISLLTLWREVSVAEWLVCSTHIHVGRVQTPSAIFPLQTGKMLRKLIKIEKDWQKNREKKSEI